MFTGTAAVAALLLPKGAGRFDCGGCPLALSGRRLFQERKPVRSPPDAYFAAWTVIAIASV